jgi:hypothetical protein
LFQVGDEIVDVLDADGKPHQIARYLKRAAGDAHVGHPCGVLDQRLDAA